MNGKLIGIIYIYVLKHICIKNVKNYIFNKNHFIK